MKLTLFVARESVQSKEEAGYRRKPGGMMDVETTFNLSTDEGCKSLALVLKTRGYTVWEFKDGVRSRANAKSMAAIALDYDEGKTVDGLEKEFAEYIYVIAPTARHTADKPRFRVLLPLSPSIDDPAKFAIVRKWLIGRFPDSDSKMLTISQPAFPCAKYYLDDNKRTKSWAHENFDEYFRVGTNGGYFVLPDETFAEETSPPVDENEGTWPELDSRLSKYRRELYRKSLNLLLAKGVKESRDGGRDNRAIVLASECRKCGIDIGETGRLLSEWNGLNNPPLTLDDLERIVRSAYAGEGYDFGESDDAVKKAREKARVDIKKNGLRDTDDVDDDDGEKKGRKPPPSLAELMTDPQLTERPKTVGRWVSWRQRITLLVGSAKRSGKSTLCTYESLAVLDNGGTVLWVSNDEPLGDVVRRFKEANVSDIDAARVRILHGEIPGIMPETWKGLYDIIVEIAPDIVVLDSIHTLFPLFSESHEVPESHETALWQAETARLRSAALAADAAVVWIHHENKSGASAGSVGIEAAVDVIAHLRPSGGGKRSPNTRALSFLGRFVGPSNDKILQYVNETDGYREIDLKDSDDDNGKNRHDKKTEDWLLSQFDGIDEIASVDMNTRIKNVYGGKAQSAVWRRIRLIAQENLGITIGKSEGAFGTKTVWRAPLSVDPKQFTEETEADD